MSTSIDTDRGYWYDHGDVPYLLRDVLRVREPFPSRAVPPLGWAIVVELPFISFNYETPPRAIPVHFSTPVQAWDFYYALLHARGAAALASVKSSMWGPVPSMEA